jgi:ATPase subunit of ABC transporter with duplicated ATPase domains
MLKQVVQLCFLAGQAGHTRDQRGTRQKQEGKQKQGRSKRRKQEEEAKEEGHGRSKRSKRVKAETRGGSKRRRQIHKEECKTDPATQTCLDMKQVGVTIKQCETCYKGSVLCLRENDMCVRLATCECE